MILKVQFTCNCNKGQIKLNQGSISDRTHKDGKNVGGTKITPCALSLLFNPQSFFFKVKTQKSQGLVS